MLAREDKFFSGRNKDLVGHESVQDGNIAAWWQDMPVHRDNLKFQRPFLSFFLHYQPCLCASSFYSSLSGTHTRDSPFNSRSFRFLQNHFAKLKKLISSIFIAIPTVALNFPNIRVRSIMYSTRTLEILSLLGDNNLRYEAT